LARRWRIRHKLTLGLALCVGIMALLLAGTLFGLLSYRWTMKSIDSKLEEMKAAQRLHDVLRRVADAVGGPNTPDIEIRIGQAKHELEEYRACLGTTLMRNFDFDGGYMEKEHVRSLSENLDKLSLLCKEEPDGQMTLYPVPTDQVDRRLQNLLRETDRLADGLKDHIRTDLRRQIENSKDDYRTSIAFVSCTCVLGAVFMLGLARLAYRWIVDPIRDLHEKVTRLAEGNFDSRIEVQSSDEMQDLAAAFNDMTERLQHMYNDLARQVNERSRQLVRSEKLAGVGFLAAGVAHEINNPLASIAFCSEALERRLDALLVDRKGHPDYETVTNYLKMVQEEAFRCKSITQRLLEFSRMGEKQRQLVSLAELVQSVISMVLHLQNYKGKQIVFEAYERPRLMINAEEIKSVVLNLIVNALDSMDEGGKLTITLDTYDGMAVITFRDSGCGMTPEVLENLFEPFFTRSRTGRGIGLGLSISHRIITQHGGDIEASSPGPDQGSTFIVRLPLSASVPLDVVPMTRAA
jgi:signal transduction histidine kinase